MEMFEWMDDTTQLSIKDIKEMLLKHENDKNKEKHELLDRVSLLEARLEGLRMEVSGEASVGSPSVGGLTPRRPQGWLNDKVIVLVNIRTTGFAQTDISEPAYPGQHR